MKSSNSLNLSMETSCAGGLKSQCQVARRITEAWAAANLFCAACTSDRIQALPHNSQAIDFTCPKCSAPFQLKAARVWNERRIPDAGYHAMMRALASDQVPNLLVMQYTTDWNVRNLLVIPSFFFTPAAIQERPPLAPTARRAGWIGCNILLSEIADVGKIKVVVNGMATDASVVREHYATVRPLAALNVKARGWTLDVLRLVKKLGKRSFSLGEAYEFAPELAKLHPNNRNVEAKIRQQLQVLRDMGLLKFVSRGEYEVLG
jgi:type II restriction enzyme